MCRLPSSSPATCCSHLGRDIEGRRHANPEEIARGRGEVDEVGLIDMWVLLFFIFLFDFSIFFLILLRMPRQRHVRRGLSQTSHLGATSDKNAIQTALGPRLHWFENLRDALYLVL